MYGMKRFVGGNAFLLSVLLLSLLVPGSSAFAQTPLAPSTLSFGNQVVNQPSAAMSTTLKNTQALPLSISSIAITGGTAPADYAMGGNCPLHPSTLGPGEDCRITVTFTPSALGMRTATLAVTDDAPKSPLTVALTGMGVGTVDLTPGSGDFGGVAVGNTSAAPSGTLPNQQNVAGPSSVVVPTENFELSRPGTLTPLPRASGSPIVIPVSGPANANGLISITVTPANPSIAAGNTQQFTATGLFRGGSTQNLTASVLWNSSAPGVATINAAGLASSVSSGSTTITATFSTVTPFGAAKGATPSTPIINNPPMSPISGSTTLTVTSVGPAVSFNPSSLTFGPQAPGTTSTAQSITLTNIGNVNLTFTSISVTGTNAGDFTQNNACVSPLAANGTCTINVTFTPTAPGPRTASVSITDNAAGSPHTASLMGTTPLTINVPGLPYGVLNTSYSATLTAIGGNAPYMWSISSGGLPSWAMLNASTGVISGTPNATGTSNFTVKATDSTTPTPLTASRGFNITTNSTAQPLSITTTFLPDGTVGIPYSNSLTATGGTGVYTWSIVSGAGSLPPCLSLANFFINGTPVITCKGSFSFTVKVTDSASNTSTQPLSININPGSSTVCESGNESVLQGQYAFSLIGYKGNGFTARVGSFTADGAGNITGGEYDRNTTGGSSANFTLVASTYTLGADNRGCATFMNTTGGSFSTRFVLGSISGSPGTASQGRMIEFDPATSSAFIATGQIFQQTTATTPSTSNFTAALSGGYAHLLTGWDTSGNGGRIACDGVKTDSAGSISSGEQYCNDEGSVPSGPTTGITGSYSAVDMYGRYTETFGTTNLVGYLVSATATGAVEVTTSVNTSNTTIMAGQEFQQSGSPYGAGSVSGTGVYYATGVNSSTSGKILLALTNSDGVSQLSVSPYYENDGGTWVANGTTGSCTYTVAANGRMSGCGGEFYVTAPNTAVYVDNDTGGFAGYALPQTVPLGGFTSVSGAFFGATLEIINQDAEADDDLNALSTTGGIISGIDIGDSSSTFYQQADSVNPFSGPTLNSNGTITQSSQLQAVAIDPQHFLGPNRTGCSGSPSCYPTIEVYGPSTADTVAVTINGLTSSSAGVTAGASLGLLLAVAGPSNAVTWTLNGLPSGSGYGTISGTYPSFTYNAPTRVPYPATFMITATSNADVSQSASVSVTISAGAGVSPFSITTTSLPSGTVGSEYIQNIQTNGGTLPIGWSVTSGSLPLTLQGTPNGVGMIHGFPRATGTYTFTVTAGDASSPKQFASQPLSIVIDPAPLNITTTSLPNGLTGEPYNQIVVATGGTQPYTWGITGGSLPGWASLNTSTGAITGTPSATGTSNFTVTVTDSTLPTHKTASQPLTITINSGAAAPCTDSGSESLLSGQYAFSLSGYTSSGYLAVVGSFTADGTGNITAGEVDSNGVLGVQSASINTSASSYSVGSNNLGCATIATSFGTFNTRLSLGSVTSSVAAAGRMVEWDAPSSSTYFAATGQLQQQTASSFSGGLVGSSSYVFEETGVDGSAARTAIVGVISTGTSSNFTSGEFDLNDNGTPSSDSGVSGSYSTADGNGRITGNNTWTGQPSANHFVLYMVSSSNSLVMTTDAVATNGVLAGQFQQQTIPGSGFGNSSLNGPEVLYMTGLNGGGSGGSANLLILSADGNGNLTGTSYYDGGGTWKSPQAISCTYSIDASGRMTCGTGAPVFYLTAANKAVVISEDSDVADGQLAPQSGGPFNSSSLSGTYFLGDLDVVSYGVASAETITAGAITFSSGGYSYVQDFTSTAGQLADQTGSGTVGTVNSNGTFSTSSGGPIDGIIISGSKFVLVDNDTETYPIIQFLKQ